jgi:hypothetical protein
MISQDAINAMERAWEQTKKEERDRVPPPREDMDFDTFVDSYMQAALFSTTDESTPDGGVPLDRNYSVKDISEETQALMCKECWFFFRDNREDLMCQDDPGQAGHDFWMTRNGHGVGFWETPDWPKEIGQRLTKAARKVGECWLYVGDDKKIYQS